MSYNQSSSSITGSQLGEGVGTSTIRTSTGQKFQNVEMVFLVDQNVEIQKDQNVENGFWVDQNVENE